MQRARIVILFLGDVLLLYGTLAATLAFRRGEISFSYVWGQHFWPFTVVFASWIIIFFIADLYAARTLASPSALRDNLMRSMTAAIILAIVLFYIVPSFRITPKTNLLIEGVLAGAALFLWRWSYGAALAQYTPIRVLFLGLPPEARELIEFFRIQPQLGYKITAIALTEPSALASIAAPIYPLDHRLLERTHNKIDLIVAAHDIRNDENFIKTLYDFFPSGIAFENFPSFYERIAGKIPVSLISEFWVLENFAASKRRPFEIAKRGIDIFTALIIGFFTILFFPLIAAAIRLESDGPIFYTQTRAGKGGKLFRVIKFRSMVIDAEHGSAVWARENDARITRVGRFLRKTRLDELPQIWNVLRGDMSLIGPRPERPEFVEILKQKIPHYNIRHLVRPGLSGWAQVNFPYGASVEDTMEKLQYDLYYIKHRTIALDFAIALKTLAVLISRAGR